MTTPGSSNGRTPHFDCGNRGSSPRPGTNATLLAREAASALGALDPKPELDAKPWGVHPTRLIRVVDEYGELWINPKSGSTITLNADGDEVWV